MKTDSDSDSDTDSVRIHIRIRIDSVTDTNNEYRIRYESDSEKVGYKYLFGYWVKAAYIYKSSIYIYPSGNLYMGQLA